MYLLLLPPLDVAAVSVGAGDEGTILPHALNQDAAAFGALAGHRLIPADEIAGGIQKCQTLTART